MKDLLNTAFRYEMGQVFSEGVVGPSYNYTLTLIANKVEIPIQAVIQLHRLRDYINNYTDLFSLTFITGADDLEYKIKPYQDNLEAILVRERVSTNPLIQLNSGAKKRVVARYKAIMTDSSKAIVEQNDPFVKDRDVMGRRLCDPITIQLIDPSVDKLRLMTVGTIARGESGMKVIETVLTKFSKEASNLAGTAPLGLDIAPGYNTEIRSSIVIDHITRVTELPNLVAKNCGGLYPSGFSYYLQNRIWYLFPPYDPQRYFKVRKNLTVVNIPKNRVMGLEKTYKESETQVVMLCTGEVQHVDFVDQNQLNYGNGARFLDATRLTNMGTMENNQYLVDVAKNMNEFQTQERRDGLSVAFKGTKPITSNKYAQTSEMAARMGSFVQLQWSNGDDNAIYPGMPVRFLYLANNKPTEAFGCVAAVECYQMPMTNDIANPKLSSSLAITIFIHHPN